MSCKADKSKDLPSGEVFFFAKTIARKSGPKQQGLRLKLGSEYGNYELPLGLCGCIFSDRIQRPIEPPSSRNFPVEHLHNFQAQALVVKELIIRRAGGEPNGSGHTNE